MKRTLLFVSIGMVLVAVLIASCRGPVRVEPRPVARRTWGAPPPTRPGVVMTSEEMSRVLRARKDLIARPSSLAEEIDPVAQLRGRYPARPR